MDLSIVSSWDGRPCAAGEAVDITIMIGDALRVVVDAPFHHDPPPPGASGSTPRLWEHEVVEVMLLGADNRYLEVELSPHGHYLVLQLAGVRNVVKQGMAIQYRAAIGGERWRAEARIPKEWLPPACARVNAYAMHGEGAARRYLAWRPTGGERPDFHQLSSFGPFSS